MSGWTVEEKPYNTGSASRVVNGRQVWVQRPKVVMYSPDGKMKVTVEMTEAVQPEFAAMLTNSLAKFVMGDTKFVLGLLLHMMIRMYDVIRKTYPEL